MRLFKRRSSDPNPQLERLSTLSENNGTDNEEEASKSYLSAWGRTWDKLKRGDSSEQLPTNKKMWYPLKKHEAKSADTSHTSVEKSELNLSQSDLRKIYDMYRHMSDRDRSEKIIRSKRSGRCISDNLELSQQQLLDYLILMKPNTEELDRIFTEITEEPVRREPKRLGMLTEEKRSRASKFKSIFSRSSSKSDDEGDLKLHPKNSSTDSLTSLINFIIPGRRSHSNSSPKLPNKIKSDESGYGSDSTKTVTSIDSPIGSLKSQNSTVCTDQRDETSTAGTSDYYNDDTDTAEEDNDDSEMTITKNSKFRKQSKKRSRSRSEDNDSLSKRKSVKFKRSPSKKSLDKHKISIEDLSQNYCDKLKLNTENFEVKAKKRQGATNVGHLEKEYKCIKLKIGRYEHLGIKIGPNYGRDSTISYSITDIVPDSVAKRNGVLRVGDEVVKLNGHRMKGCPIGVAKSYLEPKNGEVEIIVCRTHSQILSKPTCKKKPTSLEEGAIKIKPDTVTTIRIPLISPKRKTFNISTEMPSTSFSSLRYKDNSSTELTYFNNPIYKDSFTTSAPKCSLSTVLNLNNTPQKKYVGLSDILNSSNEDVETKVSFTEKSIPFKDDELFKKPLPDRQKKHTDHQSITGMRKFSISSDLYTRKPSDVGECSKMEKFLPGYKTVEFQKGPGCKSLGFSIVGGKDSPKGPMGVYVKTIFKLGQASDSAIIREGDEIISVNGTSFRGLSHHEAVTYFKSIKCGKVVLELIARQQNHNKFISSI
ncbi:unnamed protein product [Diabrotica balteata]|uniref:PDZ domain-containing protein n=1 Tax=Diabrotica balteata TaxID=107213 RepID=A0A9N9STW6_DIABA|nr:unnamed protein product [Diabrotica balteata]